MKKTTNKPYGKELILDLHECDHRTFTRHSITLYFEGICDLIDMERCTLTWWDDAAIIAGLACGITLFTGILLQNDFFLIAT